MGAFANSDMAANQTYLDVGRNLVRAAHGEAPLVVDPFAGGGSVPLEALRLGCEAFASALNPVACLILKVILEHTEIPAGCADCFRYGPPGPGFGYRAATNSAIQSTSYSVSVKPAAIAGVTRNDLWILHQL